MKHQLEYVKVNILPNNIIELIAQEGVELTIEKIEKMHESLGSTLYKNFAFLINNINNFKVPFEAQYTMASHENLKAIAFVYYNDKSKYHIEKLLKLRKLDNWNVKVFSAYELGRQAAYEWLESEMISLNT